MLPFTRGSNLRCTERVGLRQAPHPSLLPGLGLSKFVPVPRMRPDVLTGTLPPTARVDPWPVSANKL